MRTHSAAGLVLLLATGLQACGSANGADAPKAGEPGAIAGSATTTEWFVDQARQAGLDFDHVNGMSGRFYYPEILPPGSRSSTTTRRRPRRVPGPGTDARPAGPARSAPVTTDARQADRLYRNDLSVGSDGRRTLRFTDVTEGSGIDRARLRDGRGRWRHRQRRLRRSVPDPLRSQPPVPQQLQRYVQRSPDQQRRVR